MIEMSDAEYGESSLLGLVLFVLRVPFAPARRRGAVWVWILCIPAALLYYAFAVPLVVGSVVILLILMTPMVLIALAMRLLGTRQPASSSPAADEG